MKKKKSSSRFALVAFLVALLLLVGCASSKMEIQNVAVSIGGGQMDIAVRPHESLGVRVTPAIEKGEVVILEAPLPDEILGEEYPGRIRWNGWMLDPKTGRESLVQIVRYSMYRTGEYMYAFILEGKRAEISPRTRVIFLGSMGNYGSNFSGKTFLLENQKFLAEREYRIKILMEEGSPIGDRHEILNFINEVKKWNRYRIAEGEIFSPWGEADLKRVARINPGYGLGERIVSKGHITITHPVGTLASIALSVIEALNAPTEGWDYSSQLPDRKVMAAIVAYINKPRLDLIQALNRKLEERK